LQKNEAMRNAFEATFRSHEHLHVFIGFHSLDYVFELFFSTSLHWHVYRHQNVLDIMFPY
jgi:hypothetical protein